MKSERIRLSAKRSKGMRRSGSGVAGARRAGVFMEWIQMGLADLVGLAGAFFYLFAYALLQLRLLTIEDWRYTLLNVLGGVFLIYSLIWNFNLGSLISQVAWLLFTIIGYARFLLDRRRKTPPAQA
ncbi:CBU_0592 family membrane protein [Agrobacterium tumefaciens]|nr:cyclic nucleotide-binding protein [Agrobacterium tumefaciens]WCK72551.1 cyclic nucleotide-binding protein [Agrobacterium tumefaciens]